MEVEELYCLVVDESVWSPGESEPFSQALLQNEAVDAIALDTLLFAQHFSSIPQENGSNEEARSSHDRAFANLLLYLETNPILETVRVYSDDDHSLVGNANYLSNANKLLVSLAKNSRVSGVGVNLTRRCPYTLQRLSKYQK
jgi:hypothetical protein